MAYQCWFEQDFSIVIIYHDANPANHIPSIMNLRIPFPYSFEITIFTPYYLLVHKLPWTEDGHSGCGYMNCHTFVMFLEIMQSPKFIKQLPVLCIDEIRSCLWASQSTTPAWAEMIR